jgi:hypothetical protein
MYVKSWSGGSESTITLFSESGTGIASLMGIYHDFILMHHRDPAALPL